MKPILCVLIVVNFVVYAYGQESHSIRFSPSAGPAGTIVTITGADFDPVVLNNNVTFSGITSHLTTTSTTASIMATVPSGAKTGVITVTVGSKTFKSKNIFRVTPGLSFAPKVDYSSNENPREIRTADFDGDGHLDFATSDAGPGTVTLQYGTGTGKFFRTQHLLGDPNLLGMDAGDINGDGRPDIVTANRSSATVSVFINSGSGIFSKTDYATIRGSITLNIRDVNGDNRPDLVVVNDDFTGSVSVLFNAGDGKFLPRTNYRTQPLPYSLSVNDVNGDNRADLAVANPYNNSVSIFMNDGSGGFPVETIYKTLCFTNFLLLQDINSDGKPDLLLSDAGGNNAVGVMLNDGTGNFLEKTDFPVNATGNTPNCVVAADMNKDGFVDIIVANANGTVSVLLGDGVGRLAGGQLFITGSGSYDVSIGDADEDGLPDIFAANHDAHTVSVLLTTTPFNWVAVFYAILIFVLLAIGRRFVIWQERRRAKAAQERREMESLRKIHQLKTNFFSNITHEFRTPLTLIQGPANELLARVVNAEEEELLQMIRANSDKLLKLINQLLDLARFEADEMRLTTAACRLDEILSVTTAQFSSLARSKDIIYRCNLLDRTRTVNMDLEKIEAIIINLISNALKFTKAGGAVSVSASYDQGKLQLEINDNGRGIQPDKMPYIFDRFYRIEDAGEQTTEGTGLGLALVREYVKLMSGTIRIESAVDEGTSVFVVLSLPEIEIETIAATSSKENSKLLSTELLSDGNMELPLLLIVEDNPDIRRFIKSCLGPLYRYQEAEDGLKAFQHAVELIPDIIISDLMMIEMDGLELCYKIKHDVRTNHIPFIMLTAKATSEDKLAGLQQGADDYLFKPFNKSELVLKIQNLVSLREKFRSHIRLNLLVEDHATEILSDTEKFMLKVKTFINNNLKNELLSVEMLSGELNLSRAQCYRKIFAITGMAPSALIRTLKLQKAASLLAGKWGPVSQVAYEVGFDNLSYFSKAFKEEFGKSPSDYEAAALSK